MFVRKKLLGLTAGLLLGLAGTASADILTLDVAGLGAFSCDGPGAPCNLSVTLDLGSALGSPGGDVNLDGLGWDLTIDTVGASWLSEAVIGFQSPAGTELFSLTAGVGDNFPGTMFYSSGGIIDLDTALGFTPLIGGGLLTVEFYESFDDVSGAIDAFYLEPSTLTFDVSAVSEPGILALLGFGLLGMGLARRRMKG